MEIADAKKAIDKVIKKARVHLYKPIQIAEILFQDRTSGEINLLKLETYRTKSKKWRDLICIPFLGRTSTSSAKYQDDLFNSTAISPKTLACLGKENREKNGIVESYIYDRFKQRYGQMSIALNYSRNATTDTFELEKFIDLFWQEPGLRRSLDKIYEIIVYSLFNVIVDELDVRIQVDINPSKIEVLKEFEVFAEKVICINSKNTTYTSKANINRVGVTNAADRGLDMWANFGPAIQIKHLSLSEKVAENIVSTVTSDRIVIVCKDSEEVIIKSLLSQLGWKARIQSIIIESELIEWYEKALRGEFSNKIGNKLLNSISNEIALEFPSADDSDFNDFYQGRGYDKLQDSFWK